MMSKYEVQLRSIRAKVEIDLGVEKRNENGM
jgi:hypothetical protein